MGESTESINELTTSELLLVSSDVSNYKKSATAAWIIWLVLGLLGGHRYYFNQKKSATVMALITILSAGMGVIITLPWMLYDASQINKWLRLDIKEIENKSIDKILRNRKKIVKKALLDNSNKETINDTNEKPAPVSKKLSDSIVSLDNNEDREIDPPVTFKISTTRAPKKEKANIVRLQKDLYSFVVLDIETTGLLASDDGITQISAIKYVDNIKVDEFDSYINPERDIPKKVQYLTHITNELVANKPTFTEIIPQLHEFIDGLPIIGHNINFDINFIVAHGYHNEQIFIEDTVTIARLKLPELENYKLETLKKHFGITNQSHNSLDDCKTTAYIYQQMRDGITEKVIVEESTVTTDKLSGLRFCITGQFMEMSRDEIKYTIEQNGGRVTGSISKLTDYLVDGEQVAENLTDGVHSAAELKAQELIENGAKVRIISLAELNNLISA